MIAEAKQSIRSQFTATPEGYERFRNWSQAPLAKTTWNKWRPLLERAEALRESEFGRRWGEIDPIDLADAILVRGLFAECRAKNGGEPTTNTLRGRYDACKAYFDYLCLIGEIPADAALVAGFKIGEKNPSFPQNPCNWIRRPSSKPNEAPWLNPDEDAKLARVLKLGHEIGVYALARGQAMREGEICDLEDADVDLASGFVIVRDGKTRNAVRYIPIVPTSAVLISRYRAWRDANVRTPSPKFIRTRSGTISPAYISKLVKAMARRAEVGLTLDDDGNVVLDRQGNPDTKVTPHALRRTWGSDLVIRDVQTVALSAPLGHSTKRVTEESYVKLSSAVAARKVILAAGDGPFSLAQGIAEIDRDLVHAHELAPADPTRAIEELRRIQTLAAQVEQSLLGLLSADGQNTAAA